MADTGTDAPRVRPRERQRAATMRDIKNAALQNMTDDGVAALSLAKVARAVGLSPQGMYRYIASRDDLLTALIVDAYDDLANTLQAALDRAPAGDHRARWLHVTTAYRTWALTSPTRFALIYGAPIPAYHAPASTEQPSLRGNFLLLNLIAEAYRDGAVNPDHAVVTTSAHLEHALTEYLTRRQLHVPTVVIRLGLSAWSHLHGLLSLEAFGHLHAVLPDAQALFTDEMHSLLDRLGYRPHR